MELQNIFTAVWNMTITGSVVIGCVLLARLALRKAPRVFSYALWLVVLFRLLCPVSVSAPVSVLTLVDAPEPKTSVGAVEYVAPPVSAPLETMYVGELPVQSGGFSTPSTLKPPTDWNLIGTWIWVAGVGALTIYGITSYVNLKRKLRESTPVGEGIREADGIATPFVLGLIRPAIYLPSDLQAEERGYILLHEQYHLRHGDHFVKAAFWLAVCIHWFNPLVWLAFVLCGRDMEMRCDEAVLKDLGTRVRGDYAQSLLNLAAGRRFVPVPLAFGEGDTGQRVKHVLGWKRTAIWAAIPAAVLCALVLVMTACNPSGSRDTPFGHSYRPEWSYAPEDSTVTISADTLYTLTSDMGLFIRNERTEEDFESLSLDWEAPYERTELAGFFREARADWDDLPPLPEEIRQGDIRRSWRIEEHEWWLLELENGELWLFDGARCVAHRLARTDLLGVSIKQPGIESYVEPVWYRSGVWTWVPDAMTTTLVNEGAQIVLMPEVDVDTILVSEEYYERVADGEYDVTTTDYHLEPDRNGDFLLEVARRGAVHDDFAIYYVTVGEERYVFRLAFPAVPNETSVAVSIPEETRPVEWSGAGARITLQLPESWEYDLVPAEPDGYAGGILFWPRGREEGKLRFEYYPNGFGVCGTGLETAAMTLAGQTVSMGTYDNEPLWTYISFGGDFAVWGEGHELWWAEYGDTAMEILDSAEFGT